MNNNFCPSNIENMQYKNVIVRLPIDLTKERNYQEPIQKKIDIFDNNKLIHSENKEEVCSFDAHKILEGFEFNSFGNNCKQNRKILISDNVIYENTVVQSIMTKYYAEFKTKNTTKKIHCWHCSDKIIKNPCGIPIKYENDKFKIFGFFCSFNCLLAGVRAAVPI